LNLIKFEKIKLNKQIRTHQNSRMSTQQEFILHNKIIGVHRNYYDEETGNSKLVDKNMSPNENIIYHLYSNGEITFQKGGWAYLQRSEFTLHSGFNDHGLLNFEFPKKKEYSFSYVILPKEACIKFREEMNNLICIKKESIIAQNSKV